MPTLQSPANLELAAQRPPTGPRAHRWRASFVALAVLASLLVLPVPAVSGWLADCAEAAPGQIRVGLVVDFGVEPDSSGAVEVACVIVHQGATGLDVLHAWAGTRGGLHQHESGMVCTIAGYPSGTECGLVTATGYRYWQYGLGTGGAWRHAGIGPGFRKAQEGTIEGWRFVKGAGNPTDPLPRRAPDRICPPPPPVTQPAPAQPGPTPTAPTPPAPGGGQGRPADGAVTGAVAPAADPDDATGPSAGGGDVPPGGDDQPGTADDTRSDDTETAAGGTDADEVGNDGDDEARHGSDASEVALGEVEIVDGTNASAVSAGPGAPPVALLAVVSLAALLGGAALLRTRRTR